MQRFRESAGIQVILQAFERYFKALSGKESQPPPFWICLGVMSGFSILLYAVLDINHHELALGPAIIGLALFLPIILPRLRFDYLMRLMALVIALALGAVGSRLAGSGP